MYISTNSTNPSEFIGGTWESYGEGRTIVGVGNNGTSNYIAGTEGGSETHNHTGNSNGPNVSTTGSTVLSINQIPSHTHIQNPHQHNSFAYFYGYNQWPIVTTPDWMFVFNWSLTTVANGGGRSMTDRLGRTWIGYADETTATNQYTGGGEGHVHTLNDHTHTFSTNSSSNVQPYVVTYIWKRTA